MSESNASNQRRVQASAAESAAGVGRSYIDPETIVRIKNLELRAKEVVEGFMAGLHRSPCHGFSVEFTDYRQYSPGDDLRHLDWKLLARQERLYIKRFEDETNLRCYLLVDLSRSMSFASASVAKADYARTTAATLAWFLSLQRDAVGLVTFDESVSEVLPPRFRPGHLRRLMLCLERAPGGSSTDLSRPLEQIANTVAKRGLVILISDLLAPAEQLTRHLGYLRSMGHDVIVMRVLDQAEVDFDFHDAAMFHDLESGRQLYVDPKTVGQEYRAKFKAHEAEIQTSCEELGVDYYCLSTAHPFQTALASLIQARARRGRAVARNRQSGGAA